jgi:hypothetical protein
MSVWLTASRHVEPEWLDHLPAADPRAVRSRNDLRRLNILMFHTRLMANALVRECAQPPPTILDIGSGDGTFMLSVARRLAPRWQNVRVLLLDQQKIVSEETRQAFAALTWWAEPIGSDIFTFLESSESGPVDAVTANLVLHHFTQGELSALMAHISTRSSLFVACETRRVLHALALSRMLWMVGCNDVTRHDAPASVRAGFRGRELSKLWPASESWRLSEGPAGPFSHRFIARRR